MTTIYGHEAQTGLHQITHFMYEINPC